VRRYLRYIFENDPSLSEDDFIADLRCHAVELIRHYEVLGYTYLHLVHAVHLGLRNHTRNLVTHYSKSGRSPLKRTQKQQRCRKAWYCDVKNGLLHDVVIPFHKKFRREKHIMARFVDGACRYVPLARLFDTEEDAAFALCRHWSGRSAKRKTVIDLSPTYWDEFSPTAYSLTKTSDSPQLSEREIAVVPEDHINELREILTSGTNERVNRFFSLVMDGPTQLFHDYCAKQGKDVAQMTTTVFNREVRQYTNVQKDELLQVIAATPISIWSPQAQKVLAKQDLQ
jgi:hypothetical protein